MPVEKGSRPIAFRVAVSRPALVASITKSTNASRTIESQDGLSRATPIGIRESTLDIAEPCASTVRKAGPVTPEFIAKVTEGSEIVTSSFRDRGVYL
jgi:hypothetical protein